MGCRPAWDDNPTHEQFVVSWWHKGDARLVSLRGLWNSLAYARTRAMIDSCPLTCMNNCLFRAAK